jgi:uncharacterized protein YpuA (DUF1002 family)
MDLTMFENFNARRISFKEAKRILNRNGYAYSDEEVKKIVDYVYALAELDFVHVQNQKQENASRCCQK